MPVNEEQLKGLASITLRKALFHKLKSQVIKAIARKIPILATGPLRWILAFFVGKIIGIILDKTALGSELLKIDWNVNEETGDLNASIKKARDLPANVSQKEREKISDEIRRDLSNLSDFT